MQNLKYKALSIAMAVMTAASPVLSSYTAYASDNVADNIVVNDDGTVSQTFNLENNNDDSSEEKETKFLFLNLKTTGGKAIISEGKDQEQTIRLDEKQDGSEYIDVYDQNGLLISSENAAENAYMYVYEAEADNIVSVKAEADDGYVINLYELVDDDTSKPEETGFDEKVTSFMYPTFVDADKTITIGFEKTETPEDDITVEEVKTEDKKDTQEDLADDLTVNDEKSEDGETDGEEDKTENDLSGDLTVNDTVEDVDKTADAEGTGTETEGTEAGSETAEDDADADDNHVVTSLTQYRSDEFFKFNNNIVLPYYGQLRFTEVSTPASYVLNSEPFVVNLADAQNGSTVDLSKTVYNDLEPAKVQLTKYKDDGSPLAGVEFELKFVKESETATKNKSESFSRLLNVGETATATTDADGKITWENLDQGDYEIRETKTVDGCALLTDVIKVTLPLQLTKDEADSYGNVNKDLAKEDTNYTKKWYFFDCKYEIKNNQVFLMPMTGSDGTWMYGFVGFAAIAFTGCLYLLLDEKKKNKRKHRRKRR